jgi:2-amino-4-hydroxy-6-hydroxymethyldihydropteridine diphosphokinase
MHTAYLLIGGNLGNRLEYLREAAALISMQAGRPAASSSIFETEAWGNTDQNPFLNQVIAIRTELAAADLMTLLLSIEVKMGRLRQELYGPRTIDIDILFYGSEIHQSRHVTIPHPEITRRRFALVPLAEIAPFLVHPVLLKTIEQLLAECTDPLVVKKI